MARRRANQFTKTAGIVFSALVAVSMVLSLLGPLLFRAPRPATPTPAPTWTPWPTYTPTPEPEATETSPLPTAAPPPPATPTMAAEDAPVAGPAGLFRFAVLGDIPNNKEATKGLLSMIVEDGNEFVIHTGNLVGNGSVEDFGVFVESMSSFPLPFYPVPGNRDLDDDGTLTNYFEYSRAPGSHYSFDADIVHFTMANSSSGDLSDRELQWIADDLDSTELPFKVVVLHHPAFDPDGSEDVLSSGSEAFMELMATYGVSHVFAGHLYAYSAEERNGTTYVIAGGAEASLQDASYHYVQVTVDGIEITTEVRPLQE